MTEKGRVDEGGLGIPWLPGIPVPLVAAAALLLALSGAHCRGEGGHGPPPDAATTGSLSSSLDGGAGAPPLDARDEEEMREASAADGLDGIEAVSPPVSVKHAKDKVALRPRIAWTGFAFALVWMETGPDEKDEVVDPWTGSGARPGWAFDGTRPEAQLLLFDTDGNPIGEPVLLEGAGEGPVTLAGPWFTFPQCREGAIYLGWRLWNEDAAMQTMPCRYVIGAWKQDGTQVFKPQVVGKDDLSGMLAEEQGLVLSAAPSGIFYSWLSHQPGKVTGCPKLECGPQADTVKTVRINPDGTVAETFFKCGEVLDGFDVARFGDGLLFMLHDEHIGYHTRVIAHRDGYANEFWESTNPFKSILLAGGGAAVTYDNLDKSFRVSAHCVDVFYPQPRKGESAAGASCARPATSRLAWGDEGLAIVVKTKSGKTHSLSFLPGDHVPLGLLKKSLAKNLPATDAVWTGSSVGVAWLAGGTVKLRALGPDALVAPE